MKNKDYGRFITVIIAVLFILVCFSGCTSSAQQGTTKPAESSAVIESPQQKLVIVTTSDFNDTGLLTNLKPRFESINNIKLEILSMDTLKAIEFAKNGGADVLILQSPDLELMFMQTGKGLNRRSFASNSFIIVGPAGDPAGIATMTPESAFTTLFNKGMNKTSGVYFVSRGDGSGTHITEQNIWKNAGYNYPVSIQKSGPWYIETSQGMDETLRMANNKGAYTLTDEGTFLLYRDNLALIPQITKGESLVNIYSVMAIYNDKRPIEKIVMANNFITFLISSQTQAEIASYGKEKYGKAPFIPMIVTVPNAPAGWVGDHTSPAQDIKPASATGIPAPTATSTGS